MPMTRVTAPPIRGHTKRRVDMTHETRTRTRVTKRRGWRVALGLIAPAAVLRAFRTQPPADLTRS